MQSFDRIRRSCASPLARRQLRKAEQSIAGFLQAVGDGAVLEPPLADERLAARCDVFRRGRIDHIGIVGADFLMQTLGRVRQQIAVLMNGTPSGSLALSACAPRPSRSACAATDSAPWTS